MKQQTQFIICMAILGCLLTTSLGSCFDTPYKEGRDLYENLCAGCHGEDGVGLLALVPPIAGSDYLKNHRDSLACIIKYGLTGPIVVNGRTFEGEMIGYVDLKPVEIVNIINYINHSWTNNEPEMSLSEVEEDLKNCKK